METVPATINDECRINIPIHFGHYDYIRSIGSGSFSVVALVAERSSNMQYACKICSRQQLMEKNIFDRFEREVRIMQSFRHPSLVQLEDVVYDQNLIYLIMEYCSNGELFQMIAEHGRLDEDMSRRIFAQIVDGMIYIHSRDIAHRDLKPENILLDAEMNAKITDFGLCHQVDQNSLLKTPCGSPFYAPPEVISNVPYDGKLGDVWSLGVVLYTMVTGALPWQEANQIQLFQQIIDANFTIPRSLSAPLRDLISRLMRPDPKDRPQMIEIANHPWLQDDDGLLFGGNARQSTTKLPNGNITGGYINDGNNGLINGGANSKSSCIRKPLIVRPNVQSATTSSFGGSPQMANLIRRVPPSSAKKNQGSMVAKSKVSSSIVMARRMSSNV